MAKGDMTRRRFEGDDLAVKLYFLKADPVASAMDAARKGRIVEMNVQFMDPTCSGPRLSTLRPEIIAIFGPH